MSNMHQVSITQDLSTETIISLANVTSPARKERKDTHVEKQQERWLSPTKRASAAKIN